MKIQNATAQGWQEAEDGDGIVLNFLGRARGRVQKGRSPTIHTDGGGTSGVAIMSDGFRIRKLTERECMRLQGFTTEEVDTLINAKDEKGKRKYAKSVIYRFAGNAVCVDCFKRITEQILDDMVEPRKPNNLDRWLA